MELEILKIFSEYGLPGLLIASLGIWQIYTGRQLAASQEARISDAAKFKDQALALQERALLLQEKTNDSVEKLSELVQLVKTRKDSITNE